MKIFCPNCGSDNEGQPGGRLTCRACTASFDVPGDAGGSPTSTGDIAPPQYAPPPQAPQQSWNAPQPIAAQPVWNQQQGGYGSAPVTNTLAIVSLVAGLSSCGCGCVGGAVAIITGIIAHNQINASGGAQTGKGLATAGIAIGSVGTVVVTILGILAAIGANQQ